MKINLKVAVVSLLSALTISNSALAHSLEDYYIKETTINGVNLTQSYKRVNELMAQVEKKVRLNSTNYKNIDYNSAERALKSAKNLVFKAKRNNEVEARKLLKEALRELKDAQLYLIPSRKVESRALYLDTDSIPTSKIEISKLLYEIKKANFNIIYPEVFRRGYTIFPNKIADIDDQFKNTNFDVLEYIVKEAHRMKLEVYPWIWVFRVKSPLWGDSFLKRYPNLIARRDKYTFEDREPLFLSPASPKARMLITELIRQIAEKYPIDGLLLDYIRYDETLPDDTITKSYFREYYYNKYKQDPPKEITIDNPVFKEFQLWREDQVTEMVKIIKREVKLLRPQAKIGTAIFRNEKEGRLRKMQNWRHWENNLYINFVCPMLYTDNPNELSEWITNETDKETRFDYLYPSLGAHKFDNNDAFNALVGLLHKRNIAGMNIFSLAHFSTDSFENLAKGVFRNPSYIPDKDPPMAIKLVLTDLNEWLSQMPKKAFTNDLKKLIEKNDKLIKMLKEDVDYTIVKKEFTQLKELNSAYLKNPAFPKALQMEIEEELNYAFKLIEIDNRERSAIGKQFPPSTEILDKK